MMAHVSRRVTESWVVSALICGCIVGAASTVLGAAEAPLDSSGVGQMEAVEVRGKCTENAVEEPLVTPPSQQLSTTTLDREEIQMTRPRVAVDSLSFTPSLIVKRKGRKNPVGLSIRGAENANVLFDGMLVGTKEDTRFIDYLPAGVIEDIRVIRDSSGLIYGPPQLSGAGGAMGFGGVIDLRLLDPPEGHHGEMRLDIGSHGETTQHVHATGSATDDLGYVLSLDRDSYDGPDDENMAHEYWHGLARLVYHYCGDSTITFNAFRTDGERELQKAGAGLVFTGWREEYDPTETNIFTLKLNHVWNDDASTTIETYYRSYEATYIRHDLGTEDDLRETKKGIALRQTFVFPENNTLRIGGDASTWRNPTGKLYYIGLSRQEEAYSLYAQDEWCVIPEKLSIDVGLRWDRTYLDEGVIANGPGFVAGKPVTVRDRWEDPGVSWSAGLAYHVTEKQTATVRYAMSKQSAGGDIVGVAGASVEDPRETRAELGYRVEATDSLAVTLTGFWTRLENGLIYAGPRNVSGSLRPAWGNTDIERVGIELQLEGRISEGLTYFANGTWINGLTTQKGMDTDHDDKVPQYMAAGGLRWRQGPWRSAVSVKYTTDYQDTFATAPLASVDCGNYWLLDANLAYVWEVGKTFEHEVYSGVRNGLNQHFNTYPGYDDPGRSLYVGYALRW